ncbi:ABC transporter ATP-binding protein [Fulvivirga sediminis]|uniref:ABC transporter ATP-binding protein n=1 Tax=Fulvivirga sediminis TaxID=2803949 RepID=A0A937F4Q9_9BACT|nr:ABC transporter ATP-binding protein [Fulvivirga sediminis]MBL3654976.1 ABC transporter ATP-binding protein [Fulvivirga sediminis]
MGDVAIKVEGLGKKYEIGHKKEGDLRNAFGAKLSKLLGKTSSTKEDFWALKDIDFEIKKGEAVGIIGRNGAGKSTLLKILSRITEPTTGRFEINGRVSSLLEVGTGFHMELSGRENIYLNGTILGMKRAEIKAKFDEIVAFSGVEKFIDTPVKHYSSGMKVRLAFSVAAHLEPEILIVDEVLAVGDAEFQKKCLGKMDEVSKNEGRTVLFVSHNLSSIRQLCTKGILLHNSKVEMSSKIGNVLNKYTSMGNQHNSHEFIADSSFSEDVNYIKRVHLDFTDHSGQKLLIVKVTVNKKVLDDSLHLLLRVFNYDNVAVGALDKVISSDEKEFIVKLSSEIFNKGQYYLNLILYKPGQEVYDKVEECCQFEVQENSKKLSHLEDFNVGIIKFDEII